MIDAGSGKNRHYLYSQGGALAYLWDQGTGERAQWIHLAGCLVARANEKEALVLRTAYTLYGAGMGPQRPEWGIPVRCVRNTLQTMAGRSVRR